MQFMIVALIIIVLIGLLWARNRGWIGSAQLQDWTAIAGICSLILAILVLISSDPFSSTQKPPTPLPSVVAVLPGITPEIATSTSTPESKPESIATQIPTNTRTPSPDVTASNTDVVADELDTYTVRAGDTLYAIAVSFNTTVEELRALNNLDDNPVFVGQVLIVPRSNDEPPRSTPPTGTIIHTVKGGEWLMAVARQYNTTPEAIMAANGLADMIIYPGQQLVIPIEEN